MYDTLLVYVYWTVVRVNVKKYYESFIYYYWLGNRWC